MKYRIGILAVALVLSLGLATNAHAALTLLISDGVNSTITCVDNTGCDTGLGAGQVGLLTNGASLGVWTVISSTGASKPVIGPPPQIDLNNFSVSSSAGGTLTLLLEDDGFTPGVNTALQLKIGGTTDGTVVATGYVSSTGALATASGSGISNPGTQIVTTGSLGPGAFSTTVSALAGPLASGYSIIEKVVITHTGAGSTSFDGNLVLTPEPASVALLGAVMFGVSMMIRKKMHKA